MRAVRYDTRGNAEDVLRIEDFPLPELRPSDVRVRINVSAINPVDKLVLLGYLKDVWNTPLPFSPGYDFAVRLPLFYFCLYRDNRCNRVSGCRRNGGQRSH